MPHYNLALLGFGNVGQALARLLLQKRADLLDRYAITFNVTGIATGRHGAALDPQGLDLERALVEQKESLGTLSSEPPPSSPEDFIQRVHADVLFETTPVNYETGQPAVEYLRQILERGMYAITANKGPVVHAYRQLTELADARRKSVSIRRHGWGGLLVVPPRCLPLGCCVSRCAN
jgi:homoserine dehydrogenase